MVRRAPLAALAGLVGLLAASPALAGGYDTPMLYAARHLGVGGAAVGYVRDPSALFHNPAGLAHVRNVAILGDFSLLVGGLSASPVLTARNIDSETTVAPFFLVGSGIRLNEFLVLGLGLYPIASSGATYRYGMGFEDRTTLLFVEASPALAIQLPENVRLGVGYRVTYVQLERYQGAPSSGRAPFVDLSLTGHDFTGVRAGLQWTPLPYLELGLAYRHVTTTEVSADGGIALYQPAADVSTEFTLPSRFSFGSRVDLDSFGTPLAFVFDAEYALNSQNEGAPLTGTRVSDRERITVPNVFEWSDSVTLRGGVEYRVLRDRQSHEEQLALRIGYVYDGQTANESYPTAFGTPPGATQVFTTGVGWNAGSWQTNLAYAYRFGSAEVTEADLSAPGRRPCAFCGQAGEYEIHLNGFYVDASFEL